MALIDQQDAIEAISLWLYDKEDKRTVDDVINVLPSVQTEPLTDYEQRIFLVAMAREKEIGEEFDRRFSEVKEMRGYNLVSICEEIERKVKKTLWTN